MAPRLPVVIAIMSLVGAGIVSANVAAQAEPAAQTDNSGEHNHFMPSPADRAAFLDARLAALHAGLELTADQDKLWPPVEQAFRDFAKLVASERQAFHDQGKTLDPVARLQMRSDNMIARGQALKKLAAASGPLYAALNDEQKHRLPILLRAIRPHAHRFAMMEHWRMEHMHGMDQMHDGDEPDASGSGDSK